MAQIMSNEGIKVINGRCEDTDEVDGYGLLHVEQMDDTCFLARLDLPNGKAIVMWFSSRAKINLIAEWD